MNAGVVTPGVAPPISSTYTTPPAVARKADSTKAISLKRNGCKPSTSTRLSFSRIACQTRQGEESTAQFTITNTTAR